MAQICIEVSVISWLFSVAGAAKKVQTHRMHTLPAFLCLVLVAALVRASPPTGHFKQSWTSNITRRARTTLKHIEKLMTQLPDPQIDLSIPLIDGLTNVTHDLALLANELQSNHTVLLLQIHADVSSLEGLVRFFAERMGCPLRPKPHGHVGDTSYPDSLLYETLKRVKLYLEKLILHQDKLQVC